ncbi:substrate-binding domain-containing protein [Embleya sp. NPDC001921]
MSHLHRRGFFLGGAALGAGALVAGCTGNSSDKDTGPQVKAPPAASGGSTQPGKPVTIGFSAPAADHGWTGAISLNAKAQAKEFADVTLKATEGTNDVNQQIQQVQSLIDAKVDVLVILPYDGKALTAVARRAMEAGIPVVNLDRVFANALSFRTWIGGDNYGMGVNAGTYIAKRMKEAGKANPVVVEVAGIDNLELTQQRSKGFREALEAAGMKVAARQSADFTAATGQRVAAQMLQATGRIDAMWNHDDDQGIGVMAAIKQAGRDSEFLLVGGAGSRKALEDIKADNTPLKATVLYPPSMASSAIILARMIGQAAAPADLAEQEVPASITTYSAVVTKENADRYMATAFS